MDFVESLLKKEGVLNSHKILQFWQIAQEWLWLSTLDIQALNSSRSTWTTHTATHCNTLHIQLEESFDFQSQTNVFKKRFKKISWVKQKFKRQLWVFNTVILQHSHFTTETRCNTLQHTAHHFAQSFYIFTLSSEVTVKNIHVLSRISVCVKCVAVCCSVLQCVFFKYLCAIENIYVWLLRISMCVC